MSQTKVTKVMPKLRYKVLPRRKLSTPEGPQGRLDRLRKIVTALIKHERIEVSYSSGDESRGYAERLISDAIRYGDHHRETMEMASYWLLEKQLVHKLFKVLVPRYKECPVSYTKLWMAPREFTANPIERCVIELRGNVYPPLAPRTYANPKLLHNILLKAAKNEYEMEKKLAESERLNENITVSNEEDENPSEEENCDGSQKSEANDDPVEPVDVNQGNNDTVKVESDSHNSSRPK